MEYETVVDWDKVTVQKIGYQELEKFVPGEGGLQYYPIPVEEYKKWEQEQDRKNMNEWEKKELEKKKAILDLYEEKIRGNGHTTTTTTNNNNNNNSHCELKKKNKKKNTKNNNNNNNKTKKNNNDDNSFYQLK
ncbi:MAG: hypothetical protein ACR2F1_07970 [Nitrososphaeraceae archaeon]